MNAELQRELEAAIQADRSLDEIVGMLRRIKEQGASREEVYRWLENLRSAAADEAAEDRIVEVADFVAGFCAPHLRIWDTGPSPSGKGRR